MASNWTQQQIFVTPDPTDLPDDDLLRSLIQKAITACVIKIITYSTLATPPEEELLEEEEEEEEGNFIVSQMRSSCRFFRQTFTINHRRFFITSGGRAQLSSDFLLAQKF